MVVMTDLLSLIGSCTYVFHLICLKTGAQTTLSDAPVKPVSVYLGVEHLFQSLLRRIWVTSRG